MKKEGVNLFLVFGIVLLLSFSFVSANVFSDIWGKFTGKVIDAPSITETTGTTSIVGGSCSYDQYPGKCNIISVSKTDTSKAQINIAGYEGYEVQFNFNPGYDYSNLSSFINKNYLFQLTNSWYPGPKYLDKYNLKNGAIFNCNLSLIKGGTCSPSSFEFEGVNPSDYFESNQGVSSCSVPICGMEKTIDTGEKDSNGCEIYSCGVCANFPPPNFCPGGVSDIVVIGTNFSTGCVSYGCSNQNVVNGNWSQDFLVDNQSPNSIKPNIMTDNNNNVHLIWEGYPFVIFYRSLNKGEWSSLINLTNNDVYSRNPESVMDKNRIIHLVFLQNTAAEKGNINYSIYYAQVDLDTKKYIKGPVKVNITSPFMNFEPFNDILIDSSGNINLIGTFYLRIDQKGKVLEYNPKIVGQTISKDERGNIYVPYVNSKSQIIINKFNGTNWTQQVLSVGNIFTNGYGEVFVFQYKNKLFVLHSSTDINLHERGLYITGFNDSGRLNSSKILSNTSQIDSPRILINSDGKSVILFNKYLDDGGCDANEEIFYMTSQNFSSMQWGGVQRKTFAPGFSFTPKITSDSKGDWYIAWEDYRDDPDMNLCQKLGQTNPKVYYSEFVDSSERFENGTICSIPVCGDGNTINTGEKDSNGCEIYMCSSSTNQTTCSSGCLSDGKCVDIGYRKSGTYCNESGQFTAQYNADEICDNNFQCGSNLCISGKCVSQGLFDKILSWFKNIFG